MTEDLVQMAKDAARYRWLRACAPDLLCQIAFRSEAACSVEPSEPDACIDAAMAEEDPA